MDKRKKNTDDNFSNKMPPHAKELETAILGAIMLEKEAFAVISEFLKPEMFYEESNVIIFQAMFDLANKNKSIDLLTVVEQLKSSGKLEEVGGAYGVSKLTNDVVSAANIEQHSLIIVEKYTKRELGKITGNLSIKCYDDSKDVFEILDEADKAITELSTGTNKKSYSSMSTNILNSMKKIEQLRLADSHITGVPSCFNELDLIIHGWQPTDLIILAARPSVGKTAFALNIARNAALNKFKPVPVAFFSLEMSTGQLVDRLMSAESEIWIDKLTTGQLEEHEMKKLYVKCDELLQAPIFIDDTAAINIFELKAKCRRLKRLENVGLILIDYLQLMSGNNKNGNREQEISNISRELKVLAKELQVPIIALSQLSRAVESRTGDKKMPQLSDLRESGAIEQDADTVMFLYRPEYYDINQNEVGENNAGETHVKIAKHRHGALGIVKLKALLHIQKFVDMDNSFTEEKKISTWQPIKDYSLSSKEQDAF